MKHDYARDIKIFSECYTQLNIGPVKKLRSVCHSHHLIGRAMKMMIILGFKPGKARNECKGGTACRSPQPNVGVRKR